jgi:hypothetical protein
LKAALTLVGMGRRPEADPTLDALDALSRCEAAICVGLDAAALDKVRRLAPKVLVFPAADDAEAARALRRLLAEGKSVVWAGPGHPAECAPPAAARAGARFRVAKGVCSLDARLTETRQILSNGPAYYPPSGGGSAPAPEASAPAAGGNLLERADWPASPAARARAARKLVADGRLVFARGDWNEALRVFSEAAMLDCGEPEAFEWLARTRLKQGLPQEAWGLLWEPLLLGAPASRLRPLFDEALTALGRTGETSAARAKPVKRGGAKAHAARAARLTAAGDLEGARAAWDAAVAAEPGPEVFEARAEWVTKYGLPLEGLADRREALRLAPTGARRAAYAERLRRARFHDLARKELDRAAREKTAPADVFVQRAQARLRTGDWRGALADAAQARRRGTPAARLLDLRAEAAAASGRPRAALKTAFAEAGPYEKAWLEGYLALAENRPDPAPFERAAGLAAGDERRLRHAWSLAALARAWGWCPPPRREPGVVLCGLGIAPAAGSPTVECVAALRACDVVFQNSASDSVGAMLRLFCRDIRPSPFHHEYDALLLVERMFAEARRGRVVGMATFGHPLLFGPIARAALARGRHEGLSVRIVSAPSTLGEMLSAGAALGPVPRWQALVGLAKDAAKDAARIDPSAPLLLYPEEGFRREAGAIPMLEAAAARYPAGHRALVLSPGSQEWDEANWMTLADIARLPAASHKQRLVFVPPLEK